jgi:(4S)-4-hydroxy-5-phosphonooxypentane-2,3-dione isomerase
MIVRIVKMHFKGGHVETFLEIFQQHKQAIRYVNGCTYLALLRDVHNPLSYTTLSHWNSERDLEAYRNSELFKDVWGRVKVLFGAPTQAFSLEKTEEL